MALLLGLTSSHIRLLAASPWPGLRLTIVSSEDFGRPSWLNSRVGCWSPLTETFLKYLRIPTNKEQWIHAVFYFWGLHTVASIANDFLEFRQSQLILKKTPWSESASELYRQSDRRLSAKSLPTFADKGCHVVSVTDPYGRILDFLGRSRYFSIK
jgi:hypothetical protein